VSTSTKLPFGEYQVRVKKAVTISLALGPGLNRTQELTQRLAAEILSGRLQPGARLPTEKDLSLATGVSRTVVREAVAALRADGLVATHQGRGAFVPVDVERRPFRIDPAGVRSAADVLQILELRTGLEIEASGLAAERRTSDDLRRIEAALRSIEAEIEAGGNAVDADFRFHLAILRSVHNRHFPQFLEFLGNFIIPRQRIDLTSGSDAARIRYLRKIQAEHIAIYDAIRLQNITAARKAARLHLFNARRRYEEVSSQALRRAEGTRRAEARVTTPSAPTFYGVDPR
jgi:GntR family transcriptional regulator, transcriptional repressor for pyruvate dehydrogenase complex